VSSIFRIIEPFIIFREQVINDLKSYPRVNFGLVNVHKEKGVVLSYNQKK
jgi:hypothetical protein